MLNELIAFRLLYYLDFCVIFLFIAKTLMQLVFHFYDQSRFTTISFLKIKWELLQMDCEICERISEKVWDVEKSVIPNRYYDFPNQTAYFQQETYFCQNCNFIFNKHPISEEEMFKDYVYRSPDTSDDINAVNLILSLIKDKNIKTIS